MYKTPNVQTYRKVLCYNETLPAGQFPPLPAALIHATSCRLIYHYGFQNKSKYYLYPPFYIRYSDLKITQSGINIT